MNQLDKSFYDALQDIYTPEKAITIIIDEHLKNKNIKLGRRRLSKIEKSIKENNDIEIKIPWYKRISAGVTKQQLVDHLSNLDEFFAEDVNSFSKRIEETVNSTTRTVLHKMSERILSRLDKTAFQMIRNRKHISKTIAAEIRNIHSYELKNLKMLIEIGKEISEHLNEDSSEESQKTNAIQKIVQHACLVSSEIFSLLITGFPDGALARWRTLHELTVIAQMLNLSPIEVSEMFFDHLGVSSYKELMIYEKYKESSGSEGIATEEINEIVRNYEGLIQKYGKRYASDYGWACTVIENDKITFAEIEKYVDLDYLKPYYKMACNNIHAGIKGVMFKLGRLSSDSSEPLMQESYIGLIDPIQLTASSLNYLLTCYLSLHPSPSNIINMHIVSTLFSRITNELSSKTYVEIDDDGNIYFPEDSRPTIAST